MKSAEEKRHSEEGESSAGNAAKLLLHACCGPCSMEPVRILRERGVEPHIHYSNSNIAPADEYERRLDAIRDWTAAEGVKFIEDAYAPEAWEEEAGATATAALRGEATREDRCRACYRQRLESSARYAAEHGYSAIGTTLTISPYQLTEIIHEELNRAAEMYGLKSAFEDYSPHYAEATRRSREAGMYRQNYCGCAYSKAEAETERAERQAAREAERERRAQKRKPQEEALEKRRRERAAYDEKQRRKRAILKAMREEARQNREGEPAPDGKAPNDAKRHAYRKCRAAVLPPPEAEQDDWTKPMKTADFNYDLPEELIAQEPHTPRDECRLLVLDRKTGGIEDRIFRDIVDYLNPGDLIVANETRVLPARLLGSKRGTGGAAEVFLLRECAGPEPRTNRVAFWETLVRPGKRLKPGTGAIVDFCNEHGSVVLSAEVIDWVEGAQKGERKVRLSTELGSLDEALHAVGRTPLPPYIKDYMGDDELYQTVYSRRESSAAAPTAGLHFTPELIDACKSQGTGWATVELEVGLDTFRVVDEENAEDHAMHTERYTVPQSTVDAISECKAKGGRVVAVGTTSVRSLESAWDAEAGALVARDRAATSLFLLPGSEFHVVDAMITNFHVPRSTLMMLVSAFASREQIMSAYAHAIDSRYRMLSFGDAMLIK